MNFVLLVVGLIGIYPLARVARSHPRVLGAMAIALGLLPLIPHDYLYLDPVYYGWFRGETRSFEIAVIDLLAVSLWIALPKSSSSSRMPFRWFCLIYLGAALVSVFSAPVPLFAWFSIWKLLRGFFVLFVVARACESPKLAARIVTGFGIGIVASLGYALIQRYAFGQHQVAAWFSHPNSLGMAVNLTFPIILAILLGGQGGKLATLTTAASAAVIVLTLSRGSIAMFILSTIIVFLGSAIRRLTARKLVVAVAGLVAASVLLAMSLDPILERFATAPQASVDAREKFVEAADAMLDDHPMGVGLNQYSHVLSKDGYADRLDIPRMDRDGLAHNIYWLTAAELGYLGLVAYLLLLAGPLLVAARGALRARQDIRGDVLLGCFAGLVAMYIQGTAEWIARQSAMMYLFFIVAGMAAALERQLRAQTFVVATVTVRGEPPQRVRGWSVAASKPGRASVHPAP